MKCYYKSLHLTHLNVAPLAGARIEISCLLFCLFHIILSLPSRERGLKYGLSGSLWYSKSVAPLAGARIEIYRIRCYWEFYWSLPSRERGLKYADNAACPALQSSLPSRERGLKFHCSGLAEIRNMSLPSRERGLKLSFHLFQPVHPCRSPRGSAD